MGGVGGWDAYKGTTDKTMQSMVKGFEGGEKLCGKIF